MLSIQNSLHHIIINSATGKKFLTRVNQDILYNYISGFIYNKQCAPVIINGFSNHIHIVIEISVDISINQLVKEIQQNTIDFLRRERSVFPEFAGWDKEYVSISYHPSQKNNLVKKVKNQFEYHRKVSLEEELNELLVY